jgi:hypothetical protein
MYALRNYWPDKVWVTLSSETITRDPTAQPLNVLHLSRLHQSGGSYHWLREGFS